MPRRPEIWEQTRRRVDAAAWRALGPAALPAACGTAKFLQENATRRLQSAGHRHPRLGLQEAYKETGIFDKNEIYPYITEGIGEDFLPKNVDFGVIDHFEKVTDRDAAIMRRRLAREEGSSRFPFVDISTPVVLLSAMITPEFTPQCTCATSRPRRRSSSRYPTSSGCF